MAHAIITHALAAVTLLAVAGAQGVTEPQPRVILHIGEPDAEIRKILVDRVDVQHQSVGIVVGVITPEGRRVIAYGHLEKGDSRPLNGDTIFEIGSATKVFTSLLLADMVQRGQAGAQRPLYNSG